MCKDVVEEKRSIVSVKHEAEFVEIVPIKGNSFK